MSEHLIHAGKLKDQLAARLENSPPFLQNVNRFPLIEVLNDMDRYRYVCLLVR
jgi:hypothetical protein